MVLLNYAKYKTPIQVLKIKMFAKPDYLQSRVLLFHRKGKLLTQDESDPHPVYRSIVSVNEYSETTLFFLY